MFLGSKYRCDEYYEHYLEAQMTSTVRVGKFLILFGIPSLAYFVYQDIVIVKIFNLIYARLLFFIPFMIYGLYLFFTKQKERKIVEFLHTSMLLFLLLMSVIMFIIVYDYEGAFNTQSLYVLDALIVNTFVVFVFAGLGQRWLHVVIGIPAFLLMLFMIVTLKLSTFDALLYSSNYSFIAVVLVVRSIQNEKRNFQKYKADQLFEIQYAKSLEISSDLEAALKENEALTERLRDFAIHDELTNVFPRNIGLSTLEVELEKAARAEEIVALVYVDLDGLKSINDRYGHSEGDRYILSVINAFKSRLRKSDFIIRMGGDEFIIYLVECSEKNTHDLIDDIKSALGDSPSPYTIDFSYGIVIKRPQEQVSVKYLIKMADHRMYIQKRSKYNRSHQEEMPLSALDIQL